MDSVHEEEYKGFTIKIKYDDMRDDPRGWDNAGTMVCWHSRYNLGDQQPKESPEEFMEKITHKTHVILPLYLYDHSGITISTSYTYPYNDRWDAGQVGWIFISHEKAVEEWGKKRFTKKVEERAIRYLEGEVKTYDNYLTGQVYGFIVEDEDGEHIDSCWGFYPEEKDKTGYDYCLKEARDIVDFEVKKRKEEAEELASMVTVAVAHGEGQ